MNMMVDWHYHEEAWERFLESCPHATIFHHPGWYRAHAATAGAIRCIHFQWDGGQEGLMPLIVRPKYKGLIKAASAGAENGYGGLVSPTPLSSEQVEAAYAAVRTRHPNLRAYGNPHERYLNIPRNGAYLKRAEASTQVLPILAPENQRKLMNETQQKHCKRAEKQGFRFEVISEPGPVEVSRFYPLYEAHNASWGYRRWVRDREYFERLFRELGKQLVLFLAWSGDRLSGFRLVGCQGPIVMDLYLATDQEAAKSYVGPFLVARPLEWCYSKGYRIFDFMPSGNLSGVMTYKASFGSQPLPVAEVTSEDRLGHALSIARALARRDEHQGASRETAKV